MNVSVDRAKCDNHGQCTFSAPTVFRLNEQGILEYDEKVDDSLRADVDEAADVCPMQAIIVTD
ncbi:MAG: ferredoxin [Microbacteriaceae bacterium]|nr:ferredoxin [Microbacteriaceae bacterium]